MKNLIGIILVLSLFSVMSCNNKVYEKPYTLIYKSTPFRNNYDILQCKYRFQDANGLIINSYDIPDKHELGDSIK